MRPIRLSHDALPLSEFCANAAGFVQQVRQARRPLVLTQHGKSAAVLLAVEEYVGLLEHAGLLEDVAVADAQIRKGEGVEHPEAKAQVLRRRGR